MSLEHAFETLDNPLIRQFIFYPRRDFTRPPSDATDYFVQVEPGVAISTRLYTADRRAPTIIYFHGNGEVVSDHDYIAPMYTTRGINLFVADYRGYGASDGLPTFRSIFSDAHPVFREAVRVLSRTGYSADLFVMGRSLGSAPACELAASYPGELRGLIVESGFASATRLMRYLGLPIEAPDNGHLPNLSNVRRITLPSLIIHGRHDSLIPVSEAEAIYESLPATDKRLLIIEGADHNDILYVGAAEYFQALTEFVFAHRVYR